MAEAGRVALRTLHPRSESNTEPHILSQQETASPNPSAHAWQVDSVTAAAISAWPSNLKKMEELNKYLSTCLNQWCLNQDFMDLWIDGLGGIRCKSAVLPDASPETVQMN